MTDRLWRRTAGDWTDIAGEVVTLIDGRLTRLDPSASLVWRLLEDPVRETDLVAAIRSVTAADRRAIRAELASLLDELETLGLAHRVDT